MLLEALSSIAAVVVAAVAVALGVRALGARGTTPAPTAAPFLGGGSQDTHAWSRFHVRWYPLALVLVAFEMEMMFMYPWAVVFVAEGVTALVEMGVFLVVLSLGLLYAWREGVFRGQ